MDNYHLKAQSIQGSNILLIVADDMGIDKLASCGVNPLRPEAITIAEVLDEENYQCGMFGKWHLGTGNMQSPWEQGWDYFSGILVGDLRMGTDTLGYNEWLRTVFTHDQVTEGLTTDYPTKDAADSAITWIKAHKDSSWFAAVTFNAPWSEK